MRVDTNTNGHMQWYYFSIKNIKKTKVKLNLFRFRKRYSLYQRGFRPYVRSRRDQRGWLPGGEDVKYYRQFKVGDIGVKKPTNYFYLSFTYTFEHQSDQVFFAACIPYTVSYLHERLDTLESNFYHQLIQFERQPLCTSLCGQEIEMLSLEPKQDPHRLKPKQFIIINARSHPGQTSSSWVTDGLLEMLMENRDFQQWMIESNVCFRIVPMLNKDGVFIGNYRTGVVGQDFNRQFNSGKKQYFPQIHALKRLVSRCKKQGSIKLFLDIHGHSVLKNSFFFGPDPRSYQDQELIKLGNTLVHHSKYFSSVSSHYMNQRGKIQTARVFFQMEEDILSLTCQNSLGLYFQNHQTYQHTANSWKTFGRDLLEAIRVTLNQPSETIIMAQSIRPKISKAVSVLNRFKQPDPKLLISRRQANAEGILKKPETIGLKNKVRQSREGRRQERIKKNSINLKRQNSGKKYQKQDVQSLIQEKINASKTQVNYKSSRTSFERRNQNDRVSRTAQEQIIEENIETEEELLGEQEPIPDNFSEEYISINDIDTSEDDIDLVKKQELFQSISELTRHFSSDEATEDIYSKELLMPIKGFKEYKLSLNNQTPLVTEKKINSKLKPLRFQQFKMRGHTQKKIKSNMDILLANQSMVVYERQKNRTRSTKNQLVQKKSKELKKDQLLMEIFPHMEEHEYMIMRIKQMRLQNLREGDKTK